MSNTCLTINQSCALSLCLLHFPQGTTRLEQITSNAPPGSSICGLSESILSQRDDGHVS